MGCAKSKIAQMVVEETRKNDAAAAQMLEGATEVVHKIEGLKRASEKLQSIVENLEKSIVNAAQKFDDSEKDLENIQGRIESLSRRSKSIRKMSQRKLSNPTGLGGVSCGFDENAPVSSDVLGEFDQNMYPVE